MSASRSRWPIAWPLPFVASVAGVTERTVWNKIHRGQQSYVQFGKAARVLDGDIRSIFAAVPIDGRTTLAHAWRGQSRVWLADAARALQLHPRTLRRAVKRGELRAQRLGKGWSIDRDYLVRWIWQRRVPSSRELVA